MMTAGTKRANAGHGQHVDGDWIAVLRVGKQIVWECGHRHANRDHYRKGQSSAKACACAELSKRQASNQQ